MEKVKGHCKVCGFEIELIYCCNGIGCGCYGQPVDPPVCSEECHHELMDNLDKYYPKSPKKTMENG